MESNPQRALLHDQFTDFAQLFRVKMMLNSGWKSTLLIKPIFAINRFGFFHRLIDLVHKNRLIDTNFMINRLLDCEVISFFLNYFKQ